MNNEDNRLIITQYECKELYSDKKESFVRFYSRCEKDIMVSLDFVQDPIFPQTKEGLIELLCTGGEWFDGEVWDLVYEHLERDETIIADGKEYDAKEINKAMEL